MPHPWKELILSTRNRHKLGELQAMLEPMGIAVRCALDFPELGEVEETGATFADNAALKAEYAAQKLGLPALADDSGLEVDFLGGEPGVRSARYSGDGATDASNNALLLQRLQGVAREDRKARFVCALAFSRPGQTTHFFRGETSGIIVDCPAGGGGFGYDPLFLSDDLGVTLAQAGSEEKNRISHRGRALRAFQEWLNSTPA